MKREIKSGPRKGLVIVNTGNGNGFTWESDNIEFDKALAAEGWRECRERIESGNYDVVILDELTYAINYGWLPLDEVLDVLRLRNPQMHVVITGRDAPRGLVEFADLVSEINEVKHPFKHGIRAQAGIEL